MNLNNFLAILRVMVTYTCLVFLFTTYCFATLEVDTRQTGTSRRDFNKTQPKIPSWHYDKIINEMSVRIKNNHNDADALNTRGVAYKGKKEFIKAIADFSAAIKINPNEVMYYNNRGLTYREKGDFDKAIADFSKIIEFQPDSTYAYYAYSWMADIYAKLGDINKSNKNLEKAKKLKDTFY